MYDAIANSFFQPEGPTTNPQYQRPQRVWVGLTDKEYQELHLQMGPTYFYQDYGRDDRSQTQGEEHMNQDQYTTEEDTAELLRVGQLPKPLRLAAMLEKTMQWPLHGKSADCLREMYELLQRCENEMRYAGWDKLEADNPARNGVYEQVKQLLEKNT